MKLQKKNVALALKRRCQLEKKRLFRVVWISSSLNGLVLGELTILAAIQEMVIECVANIHQPFKDCWSKVFVSESNNEILVVAESFEQLVLPLGKVEAVREIGGQNNGEFVFVPSSKIDPLEVVRSGVWRRIPRQGDV